MWRCGAARGADPASFDATQDYELIAELGGELVRFPTRGEDLEHPYFRAVLGLDGAPPPDGDGTTNSDDFMDDC